MALIATIRVSPPISLVSGERWTVDVHDVETGAHRHSEWGENFTPPDEPEATLPQLREAIQREVSSILTGDGYDVGPWEDKPYPRVLRPDDSWTMATAQVVKKRN